MPLNLQPPAERQHLPVSWPWAHPRDHVWIVLQLGDYYAAARISGAPVPPPAVLSRAVAVQGFSCVCTGFWGEPRPCLCSAAPTSGLGDFFCTCTGLWDPGLAEPATLHLCCLG